MVGERRRRTIGRFRLTAGAAGLLWALATGAPAVADHLFHSGILGQKDADYWARSAMAIAEVVVSGQFVAVCDEEFGTTPPWWQPRYVTARFKVDEVFKAPFPASDGIEIQVDRDMLVYPGEDIARYHKREQLRRDRHAHIQEINALLELMDRVPEFYALGPEAVAAAEALQRRLAAVLRARVIPNTSMVADGPFFYDLEGAVIRQHETYVLVLFNRTDGWYRLEDAWGHDVYWGDEAEQMLEALRPYGPAQR